MQPSARLLPRKAALPAVAAVVTLPGDRLLLLLPRLRFVLSSAVASPERAAQGGKRLYSELLRPWLLQHEARIDQVVGSVHGLLVRHPLQSEPRAGPAWWALA